MNTQKVLLGAVLVQPELAPYCLPGLEIEQFEPDLQPVFAAVSGFWETTGTLDTVQVCAMILSISVDRKNSKSKHIMQPLCGQHKICCASPWVVSRHWRSKYGDCSNSS